MSKVTPFVSVVVPLFNEAEGVRVFDASLHAALKRISATYEIIYCDDGSTDGSLELITKLAARSKHTRVIALSRNFGKEYAMTAGIAQADGNAIVIIDADGQHPVELIGEFVHTWQSGADVVIGVRKGATSVQSRLFYSLFNRLTGERLIPHSTDFRLLDRRVADAFLSLKEQNRITRGLIDWVGFKRETIGFDARARTHGEATYSSKQLRKLAFDSFVSLSSVPLLFFGYIGVIITIGSGILGIALLIEQVILNDPLHWHFTGTAMLGTLILFLVGIVLMSQGMIAVYVSHIHTQTKRRPLYIIDERRSVGARTEQR